MPAASTKATRSTSKATTPPTGKAGQAKAKGPKGEESGRRHGVRGPANAQALLAAAHRLVAERGEDFTTQDLIREADVALQTFYRHFGGKDQILLAVLGDLVVAHCQSLEAEVAGVADPLERLHFYIGHTLGTMFDESASTGSRFMTSQHWRLHQEYPEELAAVDKPFADLVERALVEAQDRGLLPPGDAAGQAWLVNRLVMSVVHHYAFAPRDEPADVLVDAVWRFCLVGIGAEVPPTPKKAKRTAQR